MGKKKSSAPVVSSDPALTNQISALSASLDAERQSRTAMEADWRNREAGWQKQALDLTAKSAASDATSGALAGAQATIAAQTATMNDLLTKQKQDASNQAPAADVPTTELDSASAEAMAAVRTRVDQQKKKITRGALLIPMSGTGGTGGLSIPM